MPIIWLRLATCAVLTLAAGCRILSALSPVPDMRNAVDHAKEFERRCTTFTDVPAVELLPKAAIDSVEPEYSRVPSGPMAPQSIFRGARIRVRPLPGYSKEALMRKLECHQTRVTLAGAGYGADDPYVLPERWLDIDVDSEGDGFVVLVRADEIADAKQVLERARRFVAPH